MSNSMLLKRYSKTVLAMSMTIAISSSSVVIAAPATSVLGETAPTATVQPAPSPASLPPSVASLPSDPLPAEGAGSPSSPNQCELPASYASYFHESTEELENYAYGDHETPVGTDGTVAKYDSKKIPNRCNPFDMFMGGANYQALCKFVGGEFTQLPSLRKEKEDACVCGKESTQFEPYAPQLCVDGKVLSREESLKEMPKIHERIRDLLKDRKTLPDFLQLIRGCTIQEIACTPGKLCPGFNCQDFTACTCGCIQAWGGKCTNFDFICRGTVITGPGTGDGIDLDLGRGHRIAMVEIPDGKGGTKRCLIEGQTNEIIGCADGDDLKDQLKIDVMPAWLQGVLRDFYLKHPNADIAETFAFLKECGDKKQRQLWGARGSDQPPLRRCCYCEKGGSYGDVYNIATGNGQATPAQCKEACEGTYGEDQDEIKIVACDPNTPRWPER